MKTVDEALAFAERVYSRVSDAGIIAAEVRSLREENERQRFDILAMNQSLDLMREENNSLHEKHVRLHKEIVRLSGHLNKLDIEHKWAVGEAKRLTEENERLRKDAERYRWLRDSDYDLGELFQHIQTHGLTNTGIDAAIDAARGAK